MIQDITAQAAQQILGLSKSQFWRVIYKEHVPVIDWGTRCKRFPKDAILKLRERHLVRSIGDEKKLADKRRKKRP